MSSIRQSAKQIVLIDSTSGGNGDIWMRLIGFYSIAALLPTLEIQVLIPSFIRKLARYTFGDRIIILEDTDAGNIKLVYSNLGIRHLIGGIVKGNRYISPYQRSVIYDKKKRGLKDVLNIGLFSIANFLGVVQVPAWKWINAYQGYLDTIGIKQFRSVKYETFLVQLSSDHSEIYGKLNQTIPVSKELILPDDIKEKIVIFPTGTSRQFIPLWWAKRYLPDAYYAFFYKDKEALTFEEQGLKTVFFYQEPGDIIFLAKSARWTITTDSFPSHLLQYSSSRCTITVTEVLKSRIISPVFKGQIIDSQVACHPCLHLDRKNHPTCAAGYSECQNWESNVYSQNIMTSVVED